MDNEKITVVICCAGMGTRLGIGTTKALLDIDGKPLIIRQLELLRDFDDIRIVVGYQAEKVIETVNKYRKDIMFAFNYRFETTGVAESLQKGIFAARENVILIDGDVLINPDDFENFTFKDKECVCYSKSNSTDQVYVELDKDLNVCGFTNSQNSPFAWAGVAKLKREKLIGEEAHVFELIGKHLPICGIELRSHDIDTVDDYEAAIEWYEDGCC